MTKKLLTILLTTILLLTFAVPTQPVQASPSVVGTVDAPFYLLDRTNHYIVNNGQFIIEIFKGTAGYDKIYYTDYTVAVYDARVTLEYWAGNKWKQRGTPTSISYVETEEGYIVTRHYTDFLGTTYDVDYAFAPEQPIKITVRLHSGQSDSYRIIWSLDGITQTDYDKKATKLDFGTIAFDWFDVYLDWGNITTADVTDTAKGKKADIAFDIGYVGAGIDVVLDPSVVGTTTTNAAAGVVFQRRTFYAADRHWVFYTDGTNNGYRSSVTGTGSWSSFTVLGAGGHQTVAALSVFFDGTYVHYMRTDGSDKDIYYRRGAPQSDGSITWSAAEQKAFTSTGDIYYGSICVNSGGYPFIAYYDAANASPYVTKSDTNDGTWSTQAAFPFQLIASNFIGVTIVPLTENDVYVIYARGSSNDIQGRLWDDSITTWAAEEDVTSNEPESNAAISATAYNGTIYFIYLEHAEDIRYVEYSSGSWGVDTLVHDGTDTAAYPTISLWNTDGDLRVFWIGNEDEHIYYKARTGGDWDADPVDWIDETTDTICSVNFTSAYEKLGGSVGVVYLTQSAAPRDVEYAFLVDLSSPTVTNSAATNVGETTATLHGEIAVTGGVNPTVRGFEWDTDSGAPYANDWHEDGDFGVGAFSHIATSLPPDTTIYWRAYATNIIGTGYSGELSFDTLLPLPSPPTNFAIAQTGTNDITITWTTGTHADTTVIRGKEDGYPTDITDGYEVYNGALETVDISGLNLGSSAYHYRAWSNNATGYSEDYAQEKIGGELMSQGIILIFLGVLGGTFLGFGFMFKQMALAFLSGTVFIGLSIVGWTNTEALYDIYWLIGLLGIVCCLVAFIMGYLIQRKAVVESFRSEQRYEREFPTPEELSEEEAYSRELDREIKSTRVRRRM